MNEFVKFINTKPLESGEGSSAIILRIYESFYNLSSVHNERTTKKSELTIFDLIPNDKITKEEILDIIYYTLIKQSVFGFEREKKSFDKDLLLLAESTLQAKLAFIRTKRIRFFANGTNQNVAFAHIGKIWDIAPQIAVLSTAHYPNSKRIGDKPKNLDEFAERIASASQDETLKGTVRLSRCHFGKVILAIAMALDSKTMDKADSDLLKAIANIRKIPGLQITSEEYGKFNFIFQGKGLDGKPLGYSGEFRYRLKALEKIVLKELYNREYGDIHDTSDLGGLRGIIDINPNDNLNQQIRLHAAKVFAEGSFGRGKNVNKEVRAKGAFMDQKTFTRLVSIGGFSSRGGTNKMTTGNINNISIIATDSSNKLELQLEQPGNMDTFFESPEWNHVKKLLSASSRDLLALSVSNVLLLLELYLPDGFDAISAFQDLVHKKQLLAGTTAQGDLGFIMADVYTREYETFYKDFPLKITDISKDPLDEKIVGKINIIRQDATYKRALRRAKTILADSYKAISSLNFQ